VTLELGIVAPLPPARTGPADQLAALLPALARRARLTLFVADPAAVSARLRQRFRVAPIEERVDPALDLVVYHLANNPLHQEVLEAAIEGPPGLLVLHDASLHHLFAHLTLGRGDVDRYRSVLTTAHGAAGAALAEMTLRWGATEVEKFVFDLLAAVLDRHLGAQVHSRYAAERVARRCPGLPVTVVPLAITARPAAPLDWSTLGVPRGRLVIGSVGFVTAPKRFDLLCQATARLLADGVDAHLVFIGADETRGELDRCVADADLGGRVTVLGYLDADRFDAAVSSLDIAVSLRWPHVGESSATLHALLAAGRPTVVEPVGSWAEAPADCVAGVDLSSDSVGRLAAALGTLAADRDARALLGRRARAYAAAELDPDRCAGQFVDVAAALCRGPGRTPREVRQERQAAVRRQLADEPAMTSYRWLPPAAPGATLLDLTAGAAQLAALESAWGYRLSAGAPPARTPGRRVLELAVASGSVDVVSAGHLDVLGQFPALGLAECNRVLAPGGLLYLAATGAGVGVGLAPLLEAAGFSVTPTGSAETSVLARKTGPVWRGAPLELRLATVAGPAGG
jgi:glycosyltransferase involved in cell wall biosynthesis